MKASQWLSDSFRRLSRRERLVLSVAAAVCVTAACTTYVVLPWSQRWTVREAAYSLRREQWIRLQSLVANEDRLRRAVDDEKGADRESSELLTTGVTPALAASSLQVQLRDYAERSAVQLDRVDVAGQSTAAKPGLLSVPVMVQGQGDIYGLVAFLFRIQHGERLLVIDEIAVNREMLHAGSDRLLAWSLRAHGLYATSPAGS